MTSQRLLKFLAFISLVATVSALVIWHSSGEAPPPWIVHLAAGAFAAALAIGVIAEETRPRLMLRFLAALFALIAVIAFASDFSHQGAGGQTGFRATSLMVHWQEFAPSLLASTKASIARSASPLVWDPLLLTLLGFPTFAIFAVLAALAGYASRPRKQVRIFVN